MEEINDLISDLKIGILTPETFLKRAHDSGIHPLFVVLAVLQLLNCPKTKDLGQKVIDMISLQIVVNDPARMN